MDYRLLVVVVVVVVVTAAVGVAILGGELIT
jgi:hypothetical protein